MSQDQLPVLPDEAVLGGDSGQLAPFRPPFALQGYADPHVGALVLSGYEHPDEINAQLNKEDQAEQPQDFEGREVPAELVVADDFHLALPHAAKGIDPAATEMAVEGSGSEVQSSKPGGAPEIIEVDEGDEDVAVDSAERGNGDTEAVADGLQQADGDGPEEKQGLEEVKEGGQEAEEVEEEEEEEEHEDDEDEDEDEDEGGKDDEDFDMAEAAADDDDEDDDEEEEDGSDSDSDFDVNKKRNRAANQRNAAQQAQAAKAPSKAPATPPRGRGRSRAAKASPEPSETKSPAKRRATSPAPSPPAKRRSPRKAGCSNAADPVAPPSPPPVRGRRRTASRRNLNESDDEHNEEEVVKDNARVDRKSKSSRVAQSSKESEDDNQDEINGVEGDDGDDNNNNSNDDDDDDDQEEEDGESTNGELDGAPTQVVLPSQESDHDESLDGECAAPATSAKSAANHSETEYGGNGENDGGDDVDDNDDDDEDDEDMEDKVQPPPEPAGVKNLDRNALTIYRYLKKTNRPFSVLDVSRAHDQLSKLQVTKALDILVERDLARCNDKKLYWLNQDIFDSSSGDASTRATARIAKFEEKMSKPKQKLAQLRLGVAALEAQPPDSKLKDEVKALESELSAVIASLDKAKAAANGKNNDAKAQEYRERAKKGIDALLPELKFYRTHWKNRKMAVEDLCKDMMESMPKSTKYKKMLEDIGIESDEAKNVSLKDIMRV